MSRLGRPPATDSALTRRRILREARSCFGVYGYGATTNKMVADRAELTTTAIYHYFGSKRDLFVAVHRETSTFVLDRLAEAIAAEDTLLDKILALLSASHEIFREDPDMAHFIAIDRLEARRHPELVEVLEDLSLKQLIRDLVQTGVDTGEIDRNEAPVLRSVITATISGLTQLASEVDVRAHAQMIGGFQSLFAGRLMREPLAAPAVAPRAASRRASR